MLRAEGGCRERRARARGQRLEGRADLGRQGRSAPGRVLALGSDRGSTRWPWRGQCPRLRFSGEIVEERAEKCENQREAGDHPQGARGALLQGRPAPGASGQGLVRTGREGGACASPSLWNDFPQGRVCSCATVIEGAAPGLGGQR